MIKVRRNPLMKVLAVVLAAIMFAAVFAPHDTFAAVSKNATVTKSYKPMEATGLFKCLDM